MPSALHEALIQLFRDRPELAPELLQSALGMSLPHFTEVRTASADFTQAAPTEYRADLVVVLSDPAPVLAAVVEAQLRPAPDKRFSWPVYVATLRARLKCEVCLVVIAPTREVAAWAAEPIDIGPGCRLTPLVLGPAVIPEILDPEVARRSPQLAVLSAMAHGHDVDADRVAHIALAALIACLDLDTDEATYYSDVVHAALGEAAVLALEALMQTPNRREFQSEFVRKHYNRGWEEGETMGRAEGEARALLSVAEARGLTIDAEQRARVLACRSLDDLERWIRRAVTANSMADVLE